MRKLYRSKKNKILGGICGGLGDFIKFDPVFIRLILIALLTITGFIPLLIGYLIAWVIIPEVPVGYTSPRYKRLYRSVKNKKISGLCGGMAEYFKIDATLVRVVYVILLFFTLFLPLFLAYIIGSIIVPLTPSKDTPIEID